MTNFDINIFGASMPTSVSGSVTNVSTNVGTVNYAELKATLQANPNITLTTSVGHSFTTGINSATVVLEYNDGDFNAYVATIASQYQNKKIEIDVKLGVAFVFDSTESSSSGYSSYCTVS